MIPGGHWDQQEVMGTAGEVWKDSNALQAQKLFLIYFPPPPNSKALQRFFQLQITIMLRAGFQQHLHRLVWSWFGASQCLGEHTQQFWHLCAGVQ